MSWLQESHRYNTNIEKKVVGGGALATCQISKPVNTEQ